MGKSRKSKRDKPKHGRRPKSRNQLRRAFFRRQKVEQGVRTIVIRRNGQEITVEKPPRQHL